MSVPELDQVLADPGSLAARKALAAAWQKVGDPRGQILTLSLEIDEAVRRDPFMYNAKSTNQKRTQIQKLRQANAKLVLGNVPSMVESYEYVRGMIGKVKVKADKFPQIATKLFAEAPVQHLVVVDAARGWSDLVKSPYLVKLVSLQANNGKLGDREASELAASPHANALKWIDLEGNAIGRPGVEALAASAHLAHVAFIALDRNPCDPTPKVYDNEGIKTVERSPIADELQRKYGARPWLAGPRDDAADNWPPAQDDLAISP